MFDGHLDGMFFLLTNASHVDLSGNMLVSSSSQKLLPGMSESIKVLNLSHNQLSGSLLNGSDLQLFASVKVLDLSYNQLTGELPGFDFAYELQVLKLSNNKFSGSIPNDLLKGDSLLLTELDLSANNLSGSSVITALAFCELSKLCLLIIIIIIIINFFLVGFVLFSVFFRASHIVASSFRAYKHDYVNNT
jgi:hypothetical protein